jgi:hypothetical protein
MSHAQLHCSWTSWCWGINQVAAVHCYTSPVLLLPCNCSSLDKFPLSVLPLLLPPLPPPLLLVVVVLLLLLLLCRFLLYRHKKIHYYMLDFCYFANCLVLTHIWIAPRSWLLAKVGATASATVHKGSFSVGYISDATAHPTLEATTAQGSIYAAAVPSPLCACLLVNS